MLRALAEVTVGSIGIGLVAGALLTNQDWLDRHILPSFFLMRRWYVFLESSARTAMAISGVVLALVVRPRLGRFTARHPGGLLSAAIAALLALGAGELALTWARPSTEWLVARGEPLRRPDQRLGWTLVPARTGQKVVGGRSIDYAFDPAGYRVRRVEEPVDPERPTIVFAGESITMGEGLTWDESVPAQVGAMMRVQSANLAVDGFATDQAYLRLEAELPRFRRPVAVVMLFMTAIFGRNLDDDRPHLGPGLVWMPAVKPRRLASLATLFVPYRRDATVDRGVLVTREVLGATKALAQARGATPIILVPQFNREDAAERTLRRRVLDEAGLPYVFVEFEAGWRLSGDLHPNAATAHAMAVAIAERLQKR
jgi:hypothetical protein